MNALLLILLLARPSAPRAVDADEIAELVALGALLEKRGDLEGALRVYGQARRKAPADAEAAGALFLCCLKISSCAPRRQSLMRELLVIPPESGAVAEALARSLVAEKMPEEGVRILTGYVERNREDDGAWVGLVELLIALGRGDQAEAELARLARAHPHAETADAVEDLFDLYRAGGVERAERFLTARLARHPDEVKTRGLLVASMLESDRYRDAVDHLRELRRRAPTAIEWRLQYVDALEALGRRAELAEELEELKRRFPSSSGVWARVSRREVEQDNRRAAEGALKRAEALGIAEEGFSLEELRADVQRLGVESGLRFRRFAELEDLEDDLELRPDY